MIESRNMRADGREELTLCFSLSSLLRGALIMFRRAEDGAEKCALRDLRLDEAMPGNMSDANPRRPYVYMRTSPGLHGCGGRGSNRRGFEL